MKVRIICTEEELKRMGEIEEVFTPVMYDLTERCFRGTLTIEKEENSNKEAGL